MLNADRVSMHAFGLNLYYVCLALFSRVVTLLIGNAKLLVSKIATQRVKYQVESSILLLARVRGIKIHHDVE